MAYAYPVWLVIFVIIPILLLWIWKFAFLRKYKLVFLLAIIGSIIFSLPWDYIAITERIWYFEKPYILGIWFLGLPIEEWLFIIFVTQLFSTITVLLWKNFGRK